MKADAEVFKGIEFIRISNLPDDQKKFVLLTLSKDKIINILRDNVVIKDCVQYHDYSSLYHQYLLALIADREKPSVARESTFRYKLAVK